MRTDNRRQFLTSYGVGIIEDRPSIGFNGYYTDTFRAISTGYTGRFDFDYSDGSLFCAVRPAALLQMVLFQRIRVLILQNGNVGIGSTSPAATLDVAGTGYFTGTVSSDATPVGSANLATKAYVDTADRQRRGQRRADQLPGLHLQRHMDEARVGVDGQSSNAGVVAVEVVVVVTPCTLPAAAAAAAVVVMPMPGTRLSSLTSSVTVTIGSGGSGGSGGGSPTAGSAGSSTMFGSYLTAANGTAAAAVAAAAAAAAAVVGQELQFYPAAAATAATATVVAAALAPTTTTGAVAAAAAAVAAAPVPVAPAADLAAAAAAAAAMAAPEVRPVRANAS